MSIRVLSNVFFFYNLKHNNSHGKRPTCVMNAILCYYMNLSFSSFFRERRPNFDFRHLISLPMQEVDSVLKCSVCPQVKVSQGFPQLSDCCGSMLCVQMRL